MVRRFLPVLVLAAFLAGAWNNLPASSVHPVEDLAALVAQADRISEVLVLDRQCALRADGTVETRYTFSTITPMKGVAPQIQEVRMPGGVVAGVGLHIPGLPSWEVGERVVLFLSQPSEGRQWRFPVGLGLGSYRVEAGGSPAAARVRAAATPSGERAQSHDYREFIDRVLHEVAKR